MKPIIGSHSDNDRDNLYRFARRSDPQYYPEPAGWTPDAIVMTVALVIALLVLFGVWWTESGL